MAESTLGASSLQRWWHPLWEFVVHVFVGTFLFFLIALPALGLDWLVTWLAVGKFSPVIIWGIHFAEYTLFFADITLFVSFVFKTTRRTVHRL